jgi:O-antigen/teichoic acid export membrane protein
MLLSMVRCPANSKIFNTLDEGIMTMNEKSRTRNSVSNAAFAIINKIVSMVTAFANRTIFIYVLGDAILGLNSLFTTILTVLSLSELGISSAITFHMYKPIKENDTEKLKEISALYKRCYFIIGTVMFVVGLCLIPILKYIVNFPDTIGLNIDVYFVYVLTLFRTVVSYWFCGYSQSIIEANQKQRIISQYTVVANIVTTVLLAVGLYFTRNYYTYLCIVIIMEIARNIFLYGYSRTRYSYITDNKGVKVSKELKRSVFKDVYSIFLFKVTATIGQSIDNILISLFLGTLIVGYYGNYVTISVYAVSMVTLVIKSFAGSVGNLVASGDKKHSEKVFLEIDFLNFVLMSVVTIGIYQLSLPFIRFWLHDEKYVISQWNIALLCANNYIISAFEGIYVFRNALGLFRYGKYNFLLCGISNLCLSIILGRTMGLTGILLATFISYFVISTFPFPYYLYRKGFGMSPKRYNIEYCLRMILLVGIAVLNKFLCSPFDDNYSFISLLVQGVISIGTTLVVIGVVYCRTERVQSLVARVKWRKR